MIRLGTSSVTSKVGLAFISVTTASMTGSAGAADTDRCAGVQMPSKPITVVLPSAAGNSSDAVARYLTQAIAQAHNAKHPESKINFIIENISGASGTLGVQAAKGKMEKDPSVLLFSQAPDLTLNPHVKEPVARYESKDFTPVSYAGAMPYLLLCNKKVGASSIASLAQILKSKELSFAHDGETKMTGLAARQLAKTLGVRYGLGGINPIPYRGSPQAINDVVGGTVDCMFQSVSGSLAFLNNPNIVVVGKASPDTLTVASLAKAPAIADDAAAKSFAPMKNWMGFFGSKSVKKDLAACLDSLVAQVLNDPKARTDLEARGLQIERKTPEQFQTFFQGEEARMQAAAEEINKAITGGGALAARAAAR